MIENSLKKVTTREQSSPGIADSVSPGGGRQDRKERLKGKQMKNKKKNKFPLGAAATIADKPPGIAPKQRRAASLGLAKHILIVDDETLIAQMGKEILEGFGYRITTCTSSLKALETVRKNPKNFDLVITDLCMPRMNGLELARELILLRPGLPIILWTGLSDKPSANRVKQMGIIGYLTKPVPPGELNRAIRRALKPKAEVAEAVA
ncbi:MAG: response regulator [Deltaproteobacteria bacterium]|nr:MAG: response regulator [Deltaproteobacteria bacterium]